MSDYEMITLLHPRLDEEGVAAATEWVQTRIKDLGGEITAILPWGRRRLAYQIEKLNEATYVQFDYRLDGSQLVELNRVMGLNEDIIRQLPIRKQKPSAAVVAAEPEQS